MKDAVIFNTWQPLGSLGSRDKGFQGEMFYAAPNPERGAVFTYWVKEGVTSLKSERTKAEGKAFKEGGSIAYPSLETFKAENSELPSYLVFTIKDASGDIVSELRSAVKKGMNRITWDLTYAGFGAVNKQQAGQTSSLPSSNVYVVPGTYTVSLSQNIKGELSELAGPVSFQVKELDNRTLPAEDWAAMAAFKKKAIRLVNAMNATRGALGQMNDKISSYKAATKAFPAAEANDMMKEVLALEAKVRDLNIRLNGDSDYNRLDLDAPYSTRQRAQNALFDVFGSTANITGTSEAGYDIAADEFGPILADVKSLMKDFDQMDNKLGSSGAPLTPGRLPDWKK